MVIEVRVRESSVVKPAEETPKVCLWTSNFDQLCVVHAQAVYFYKPPELTDGGSSDNFFKSTVLKDGLGKALVTYYPVAGRLKRNESGRAEIDCTGEGAIFIEAETDSLMEDLGEFTPNEQLTPLFPKLDYSDDDISLYPPFLVQASQLKSKCNKDEYRFSTYEVVAGHIWRCLCKARELRDDEETTISIPLDCRSRSRPPLPDGYFGNAIFDNTVIAFSGDIVSKPLSYAVNLIHETFMSSGNDEYLRSAIDYLELHPSVRTIVKGKGCNFRLPSWVRLPIYEADFGWGKPIYMGPGVNRFVGRTFLIPNPPGSERGFFLIIPLESEHQMNIFKKNFYDI
ncbi:hypothetical protein MKX01_031740 [Papaver californicum]|nr:hypothetical protein MKX01_031740 [Papaver californicum]